MLPTTMGLLARAGGLVRAGWFSARHEGCRSQCARLGAAARASSLARAAAAGPLLVELLEPRVLLSAGPAAADFQVASAAVTPVLTAQPAAASMLDNNLQVVDLTDLDGNMPLDVVSTTQTLSVSQNWEHSTFKNPNWPQGGNVELGYPSVVKNDRGPNADGKYYLFYAHHNPRSGIGVAVADSIKGPFSKNVNVPGRSDNQVVPAFHADDPNPDDPDHTSSPWVVWNEDEQLWFLYFHYFNHLRQFLPGFQHTAMATTPDLASHNWTVWTDASTQARPNYVPVLPATSDHWINEASSYNTVHRLPSGQWLAFLRGKSTVAGEPTTLGFATSNNGRNWNYFAENPVIHQNDGGGGRQGVYRPSFVGYLGPNAAGKDEYLVAWQESHLFDGDTRLIYGKTTDFKTVTRDPRGHVNWEGKDGPVSAWREGDRLYLFSGNVVHEMVLPVKTPDPDPDPAATLPYSEDFNDLSADALDAARGNWIINSARRYRGEAPAGSDAVSLVQLADPLPVRFAVSTTLRGKNAPSGSSNAAVVFDYESPSRFKFAGAFFDTGDWQIGQVSGGNWNTLAAASDTLAINTDYGVEVVISNSRATLSADGIEKISHRFGQSLSDGQTGLGTHNAIAVFDDLGIVSLKAVPTGFDFGTRSSAVEDGFQRTKAITYGAAAGFGWLAGAKSIRTANRGGAGSALEKDLVTLSKGTFEVEVNNGRYEVTAHLGDVANARDQMGVFLEGIQVATIDTAAGQIVASQHEVEVSDGRLSLRLEDLGGSDPLASIAGLSLKQRDAGLVAHLALDEGSGTMAADTSAEGNDHTATLVADTAWSAFGLQGTLTFDGTDDMVSVPNSTDINRGIHQTLTISAWFLVDDATIDSRKQVIYEQGSTTRGLNLYVFDGRLYAGGWNTPQAESNWGGKFLSSDKIESGRWHHVALVLNGGPTVAPRALTAYLDGARIGRRQGSQLWNHSGGIGIGHVNGTTLFHDGTVGSTDGLAGMIDDVRVYDRALPAAEVADLAAEVLDVHPDTAWVGYWSFDEGAGTTAADTSPRGIDHSAALVGDTAWISAGLKGAMRFDGDGDWLSVPSSSDLNQSTITSRTVSVWFRVDDASISGRKQVIYEQGGRDRGLNLYVHAGRLYFGGWNRPADESAWSGTYLSSDQITSGQWHHAALVLQGGPTVAPGAFTAFLDGVLIGSGDGAALWPDTGPVGVGAVNGGGPGRTRLHDGGIGQGGSAFAGSIDELRVYNRALAPHEITLLASEDLAAGTDYYSARFDFGTDTSTVESGFTPATDASYDAAQGHGWLSGADGIVAIDSGHTSALLTDAVQLRDGSFVLDVPSGTYDVIVHLGSATNDHNQMELFLQGLHRETLSTAAGQVLARTYRVAVPDGQLALRLTSPFDQLASIAGLEIAQTKTFEQTFDLDMLLANFGTVRPGGVDLGDFDNDGLVGDADLAYLLNALGAAG